MVLYLILGVTLYDDDSRGSPMTALDVLIRERLEQVGLELAKAHKYR
jgi:hypothetical protein